jgi:hypothetical protein
MRMIGGREGMYYILNKRLLASELEYAIASKQGRKFSKYSKSEPLTVSPVQSLQTWGVTHLLSHSKPCNRAYNVEKRAINAFSRPKVPQFW